MPDADTVALDHFDEGAGTTAADASGNGNAGELVVGGKPEGPEWSAQSPRGGSRQEE
jgi:hypothetical protein